jgi:hypothetical protein
MEILTQILTSLLAAVVNLNIYLTRGWVVHIVPVCTVLTIPVLIVDKCVFVCFSSLKNILDNTFLYLRNYFFLSGHI